jgi:hypothetical protein
MSQITMSDANRLSQELKHLKLEVSKKKHYASKVKWRLCKSWINNLEQQEAKIIELNNQLQGAYLYGTESSNQSITNFW